MQTAIILVAIIQWCALKLLEKPVVKIVPMFFRPCLHDISMTWNKPIKIPFTDNLDIPPHQSKSAASQKTSTSYPSKVHAK